MISFLSVLFVGALSVALAACNENNAKPPTYTQIEVIQVKGTCHEDQTQETAEYTGEITRSRDNETKEILTGGSVTNTRDISERIREEAEHPTKYQPPFMVDFTDVQVDTNKPELTLHGVSISDRGDDDEQGYDTTCELTVVMRGSPTSEPTSEEDER